jgi:hypothetical protein
MFRLNTPRNSAKDKLSKTEMNAFLDYYYYSFFIVSLLVFYSAYYFVINQNSEEREDEKYIKKGKNFVTDFSESKSCIMQMRKR